MKHRRHIKSLLAIGCMVAVALLIVLGPAMAAADAVPAVTDKAVIINEVKRGGVGINGTANEFITLYNPNDSAVNVASWTLEYAKPTFDIQFCDSDNWKAHSTGTVVAALVIPDGPSATIPAHSVSGPFSLPMTDSSAGSIHLVDNGTTKTVQDTVGWQYTESQPACRENSPATVTSTTDNKSLSRLLGCDTNEPVDSGDNSSDFVYGAMLPSGQISATKLDGCTPTTDQTDTNPPATTSNSCASVVISELLPNPAGTDTGHEFVELHNPTSETIDLEGCSLQVGASSSQAYVLAAASLQPGQFLALGDNTTSLTLPNSSGGAVWLLDADQTELANVTYPAAMDDDVSWAFADGIWASSYSLTPNTYNIIVPLKPCPDGQVRNPETNRCVEVSDDSPTTVVTSANDTTSSTSGSSLTPCKAGQERNPETNRCRNITSASTANTVTPCKEGQERNPETNRCRNVTTASTASTAKACPAGQERNPATNRCRKIIAVATSSNGSGGGNSDVQDVASSSKTEKPYMMIGLAILGAALAYGIYEWRQEIMLYFQNSFKRLRTTVQS